MSGEVLGGGPGFWRWAGWLGRFWRWAVRACMRLGGAVAAGCQMVGLGSVGLMRMFKVCEPQQSCPSSTASFRSSLTNHAATDKNRRAHPTPCHPSPNHTIPHHTTPAAAESLPDVLVRKLKPGGRMVIPVGPQWEYQVCLLGTWWGRTGQGEFTGGACHVWAGAQGRR